MGEYNYANPVLWIKAISCYRRLLRIRPPDNPPMVDLLEKKSTWALIWSKSLAASDGQPGVKFWGLGCGY